jgi:hypothetical protein
MIVYKFYLRDAIKGDVFLGSLPEKRKNPQRVGEETTEESVLNWGRTYFGRDSKDDDIYFIRTVLEEREKRPPNLSLP